MIIDSTTITGASSIATPAVVGTTAGTDAAAGVVGEYITSTRLAASSLALNNAIWQAITSITLTAGDWDVSGIVSAAFAGTAGTYLQAAISTSASAVAPQSQDFASIVANGALQVSATHGVPVPTTRINVSASTTVYLIVSAGIPGSATGWGRINARRVR